MRIRMFTLLGVLAVVLIAAATPAHAIAPFVQWQDSDDAGSAFGAGLKHSFLGPVPIVGFDLRASFLHYDEGGGTDLFPLEAAGTVKFGILYAGLSVGYFLNSSDTLDEEVGYSVLGGVTFGLFGLGAFGELRYLMLDAGPADLSGIGAQVGVTLPL